MSILTTTASLRAGNVSFSVGSRTLISDVTVEFTAGEFSVLLGANGAGKSTLIRLLARQLQPDSGAVHYSGEGDRCWTSSELARFRAVLSQHIEIAFPLAVYEVVLMGRYPHFTGAPTARDRAACRAAMRRLDVLDWAERDYLTLSGGERQRVQFARVLAQLWQSDADVPRYLLLDEPLTFLDIRYQLEFLRLVRTLLTEGNLVAVGVVHDLDLAARYADHVVVMSNGRVLTSGTPSATLTPECVFEAFGVRPEVRVDTSGRIRLDFD